MRKIIVSTFSSLDGVMQAPGGPEEDTSGGFTFGGWIVHYWDEAMGEALDGLFAKPFDLLLGRVTYDIFAGHWPRVSDEDPIAKAFNAVTKYVATHEPDGLTWRGSRALGADVVAALRDLKAGDGPDLLVQGSGDLIQTLLQHDLIDEISVWTFPVILGHGKRLFGGRAVPSALKLTKSQVSTTGVIVATYERDGAVITGSFALPDPAAGDASG